MVEPTCRSCHARIRWVETTGGRPIPLDVDPHPEGNVTVGRSGRSGPVAKVWPKPDDIPPTLIRFHTHFTTCPQGKDWSGKR